MRKNDLSYGVVRHCAVVLAALVATGAVGAVDPVAYVREALARGEKMVTVPKGRYVIDTDDTVFFRLKGLAGVTVDFGGSELVCKKRTRYIGLEHCTNTVVRNVTLDMDPLPFSQGVIEKVGPDGVREVCDPNRIPWRNDATATMRMRQTALRKCVKLSCGNASNCPVELAV